MSEDNYQREIRVKATPGDVYEALTTGYAAWWTEPDGAFEKEGDVVRFGFSERHGYWTFKAVTLSEDRIELQCVEAKHIHPGGPAEFEREWLGTHVRWEFQDGADGKTVIRFEHDGLTPELHCYEVCSEGWDMFFVDSLKSYLDTGDGKPFRA
ncbi:SRPBCC domain-containing protein [Nisaea acidiphila]|uniref:SRPBCC domain-containing protein n=1 Tax=Nisaea acidiphila TaxID=1862145 RepID=A0A9J7AQU1_9PROT|nr:SRPBCC domain-containing protein [Nisaea acidiphila]UUX48716.1 SRPBCC domain-containing protein [Nisaea acidiphila]